MPQVGFEPTIPAFERKKTFRSLDRSATAIGNNFIFKYKLMHLFIQNYNPNKCGDLRGGILSRVRVTIDGVWIGNWIY
jgi:hypothetical protein